MIIVVNGHSDLTPFQVTGGFYTPQIGELDSQHFSMGILTLDRPDRPRFHKRSSVKLEMIAGGGILKTLDPSRKKPRVITTQLMSGLVIVIPPAEAYYMEPARLQTLKVRMTFSPILKPSEDIHYLDRFQEALFQKDAGQQAFTNL